MSNITREQVEALLKKQDKIAKATVSDPNLKLFSDDQFRYKAYRWYCLKNIVLKVSAIAFGATAIGGGIVEVIRNGLLG